MLPMYKGKTNSPATSIVASITNEDTTIIVVDGSVLPEAPNIAVLGRGDSAETILYNIKEGNTLSNVIRGYEGNALNWTTGTTIARNFTAKDYDTLVDNIYEINNDVESHKAETTPHAELVDRTITVGVGKDFETIQGAIDSLKKRIDATIGIVVDAGTYNEDVKIEGFTGKGRISLLGATRLNDAGNYKIKSLTISYCSAFVYSRGFEATTTTGIGFIIENSIGVIAYYLLATASSTFAGVKVGFSTVQISYSQVSNHAQALYVYRASTVSSNKWTAGSGNAVGIECCEGSTVGKYLGQPQGTTAEVTKSGGVIR